MMKNSEWTIFCPGPSLSKISDKNLQHDPEQSIAVNGAILNEITVRYWAMMDAEVFTRCIAKIAVEYMFRYGGISKRPIRDVVLWIPENWNNHMHKWSPDINLIFKELYQETYLGKNLGARMPFAKDFAWSEYTLSSAIALAILKGAKKIRIIGADMKGEDYFSERLGNKKLNHNELRWQRELEHFEKLQKACVEHGIEIIRKMEENEETALYIRSYFGIGDNIYQYPFIKEASQKYKTLYLDTPIPEIYHEITNIKFVKPETSLRTQRKHMDKLPNKFWEHEPEGIRQKRMIYHYKNYSGLDIRKGNTVVECFNSQFSVKNLDFRMPVKQEWIKKAQTLLGKYNICKPLCVIKEPSIRKEWSVPSRSPKLEYFQMLIDRYKDDYFFISVADTEKGKEELIGELKGIDVRFIRGEVELTTLFGLVKIADVVICPPCFMIPLTIALKIKCLCIFGGYMTPEVLIDKRMGLENFEYIAPEPFCNCFDPNHDCNKEIEGKRIIEGFEKLRSKKKNLLLVRLGPEYSAEIARNKYLRGKYNVFTMGHEPLEKYGPYKELFKRCLRPKYSSVQDVVNVLKENDIDIVIISQKLFWASTNVEEACKQLGIKYLWAEAFFDNKLVFDYVGLHYCPDNEIKGYVEKIKKIEKVNLPRSTREKQRKILNKIEFFKKYNLSEDKKYIVIMGQTTFDMSLKYSINPKIKTYQDYIDLVINSNPDVTFIFKDHPLYKTVFKDRTDTKFIREYPNIIEVDENIQSLFNSFDCFTTFSSTTCFEGVIHGKKFAVAGITFLDSDDLVLRLKTNELAVNLYSRLSDFKVNWNVQNQYLGFVCNKYAIPLDSSQLLDKLELSSDEYYGVGNG